ncbi:Sulfite exporter TauE/SafE [compost metagenome]
MDKLATTATFASCMSAQHLLKMAVFSAVGFAFWDWLPLVALMIVAGVAGSWLGLKLLDRIPAEHFKRAFAWIVTLLALRLLWQASGF